MEKLFKTHQSVVMTGGSGLYIDAVCNGLDDQPEHDPEIRKQLNAEYKSTGIKYLQDELLRLDPALLRSCRPLKPPPADACTSRFVESQGSRILPSEKAGNRNEISRL